MTDDTDGTAGVSEFIRFCDTAGWMPTPIPRAKEQTPDFDVMLPCSLSVVVEVKTLTPNEEERRQIERRNRGEIGTNGCTPGERLRRAIRKANRQLKAVVAGRPAILFIHNTTDNPLHTDPYSVATAMQGLDTVDVAVPSDPALSPTISDETYSGHESAMRADANTTTSAIAILREKFEGPTQLVVFHNRHAAVPLNLDAMRSPLMLHLGLAPDAKNSVEMRWVRL